MPRGPAFVDREEFESILRSITAVDGSPYQDLRTIYGDMSRLVVAWLATTAPEKLQSEYQALSWGGTANVRAIHEAAKQWLQKYHPDRYARLVGPGKAR
jgi:hypothetical protein